MTGPADPLGCSRATLRGCAQSTRCSLAKTQLSPSATDVTRGASLETMEVLVHVTAAALASFLSDGFEHYRLFRRHKYKWPIDLPIPGVLAASVLRAVLSVVAVVLLGERFMNAVTTPSAAVAVGLFLPHVMTAFFGGLERATK